MHYTNENTTDYLFRFCNSQKANEACNVSIITGGVQEHGMNIIFPFHNTGFDYLQEDENKEAEKVGEEMLYVILYIDNSDKSRFDDL